MWVAILCDNWTELICSVYMGGFYILGARYARLVFITYICVRKKFLFPFPMTIFFSPGQISNHFLLEFKKFRFRFHRHIFWGVSSNPLKGNFGHIFTTTSQLLVSGWTITVDFFLILHRCIRISYAIKLKRCVSSKQFLMLSRWQHIVRISSFK